VLRHSRGGVCSIDEGSDRGQNMYARIQLKTLSAALTDTSVKVYVSRSGRPVRRIVSCFEDGLCC